MVGGGEGEHPTFDAESKSAEIPNSLYGGWGESKSAEIPNSLYGGGGKVVNIQLLMLSPNILKSKKN